MPSQFDADIHMLPSVVATSAVRSSPHVHSSATLDAHATGATFTEMALDGAEPPEVAQPAAFRLEPGLVAVAAGGAQQMHGHYSGKQHCISSLSYVTWQAHLMGLSPEGW